MNNLDEYVDYFFYSSSERTPEYNSFEKKYKNFIKKQLPEGYKIKTFHKGHFECSFVIQTDTDKFIYLASGDVRQNGNQWRDNILIRAMEHETDWRGKTNYFTDLEHLKRDLIQLNENGYLVLKRYRNSNFEM